jgi:antitoxin component YwqK of YwqJK toxin-antitoxin module
MSKINGKPANDWIAENRIENGLFRVYWKDITGDVEYDNDNAGVTFDSEEGEGLRYEWYYKDGERADGECKGWYSDGSLRSIYTYKNRDKDGLWGQWWPDGKKRMEGFHKDGKQHGIWRHWSPSGVLIAEEKFNDGKKVYIKHYDEQGEEILDSKWEPGI